MADLEATKRRFMAETGDTHGVLTTLTTPLSEAGLIRVGKRGGTHVAPDQRSNHLMHFVLGYSAPRKTQVAEHVRRHVGIMPTFQKMSATGDPIIDDAVRQLGINTDALGETVERIIDLIANNPRVAELVGRVNLELEVLETPPLYVTQANIWLEHNGRKYSWHYSGLAQYSTHDGTPMPTQGALIKAVKLGPAFFIAAGELWADTLNNERTIAAA